MSNKHAYPIYNQAFRDQTDIPLQGNWMENKLDVFSPHLICIHSYVNLFKELGCALLNKLNLTHKAFHLME